MISVSDIAEELERRELQIRQNLLAGNPMYLKPDPALGWTVKANSRHHSLPYESDDDGFRATPNVTAPGGRNDLLFLGDSLVHGDEVSNAECWTAQVAQLTQRHVSNAAVPGYGTDQAVIRYESMDTQRSETVYLGLPTCDVDRNVNVLRLHRSIKTAIPFMKPRYVIDGQGELRLVIPPFGGMEDLKAHYLTQEVQQFLMDYDFYHPTRRATAPRWRGFCDRMCHRLRVSPRFGTDPYEAGIATTLAIVRHFHLLASKRGSRGVVLLLPTQGERPARLNALARALHTMKIPFHDVREAFEGRDVNGSGPYDIWRRAGHYGPVASRWVAEYLAERIA